MQTTRRMAAKPPTGTQHENPIVRHFVKHYRTPNFYTLRKCGACGYKIGYFVDEHGHLFYDAGCDCTYGDGPQIEPRSWEMLIEFFRANPQQADFLLAFNIDRDGNDNPIEDEGKEESDGGE